MKATRKLLALLLALLLTAALTVPALANGDDGTDEAQPQADTTYTITINNNKDGHIYKAYQVFAGDLADGILSNIQWGTGVNGGALLSALKGDETIGSDFAECTTAADVAKVLAGFESDSANLDAFAKVVAANLGTVTVIYKAHLNENATVNNASGSTNNKNTVKLEFSNNPYWNGEGTPDKGETPEDTVWVFTYQVNNTKVDASNENKPLAGAGFKLYSDENCGQEIALIYDETKQAYRPVKGEEQGVEMISAETTGVFNIIGLDAGTYYLKETTVPAGYNEMSPNPFVVTISATHVESNGTANVTLDADTSTMTNEIANNKGATLPETGGMGTTVFYVLGGILAVGAGVLLVARRRMRGER